MNPTISQLMERKSVRVFEDREISSQDKETILLCAANAPTAGNQQLYTILDITDPALKAKLAHTCDHQPFIAQARMVLIFLADCRKWHRAFQAAGCQPRDPGVGDLMLAVTDAAIAAQNCVAAAHSLGIGSCYIGDIIEHCELHRQMLHLPEYLFPCCMLVFGYPTPQQMERPKPQRIMMKHIVHENGYRDMDDGELKEMLAPKAANQPYKQWIDAFCARKYNSDFSREMTRSTAMYLKDYYPLKEG